ncbi:hypothetical protein QF000_005839 [Paraburkholderia atlantica]
MPERLRISSAVSGEIVARSSPNSLIVPPRRPLEAENLPHQRGLARARAADDRHDLAAPHVEAQMLMHDIAAVALGDVDHLDHRLGDRRYGLAAYGFG